MAEWLAFGLAAALAALGFGAGCGQPVVAERFAFGLSAQRTALGLFAVGVYPFFMRTCLLYTSRNYVRSARLRPFPALPYGWKGRTETGIGLSLIHI